MCSNKMFRPLQKDVGVVPENGVAMDNSIIVEEYIYTEKSTAAFTSGYATEHRIITGRQYGEFVIYYGNGESITNDDYLYSDNNEVEG